MFSKILFAFMVVLTCFIVGLSALLYGNFQRATLTTAKETNNQLLSVMSASSTLMNDTAKNFAWSVFSSSSAVNLMYQDQLDYPQIFSDMTRIDKLAGANAYVHSVYIYNDDVQMFFSTGQSVVNPADLFYDHQMAELIRTRKNELDFLPIYRMIDVNFATASKPSAQTPVFSYVLYDVTSRQGEIEGAVIVNIKAEYLQQIMSAYRTRGALDEGNIYIVDRDATVITALENQGKKLKDEIKTIMDNIRQSSASGEIVLKDSNGVKNVISYTSLETLGWKLVYVRTFDSYMANINNARKNTILLSLGALLLGVIVSYVVSRRLHAPFHKLKSKVLQFFGSNKEERSRMDEVSLLHSVFLEALHSSKEQAKALHNTRMKRRLLGQASHEPGLPVLFEETGGEGERRIVVFFIDRYAEFAAFTEQDQALYRYSIGKIASEYFGLHDECEAVDMGDHVAAVLRTKEKSSFRDDELRASIGSIGAWCSAHLKLSVTTVVSDPIAGAAGLHRHYLKAVHLSRYRLLFGLGSVIDAERVARQKNTEYKVATADEKELYDALIDGKRQEAVDAYDKIMGELKLHAYEAIMSNVLYLFYSLFSTVKGIEKNSLGFNPIHFNEFFAQIYKAETLAEIDGLFHGLIADIAAEVMSRKANRRSTLIDSIIGIIELNYKNPGLCADMIADELRMSKMYVGRIFREEYGATISEYLLELRMNKAVQLIGKEKKSLNAILDEVGVENKKYFYTLFKKRHGVSFRDYLLHDALDKERKDGSGGGDVRK